MTKQNFDDPENKKSEPDQTKSKKKKSKNKKKSKIDTDFRQKLIAPLILIISLLISLMVYFLN